MNWNLSPAAWVGIALLGAAKLAVGYLFWRERKRSRPVAGDEAQAFQP